MRFETWDALGNAYVVVERREAGRALEPADARRLCDPASGAEADGVLEVVREEGAGAEIAVWNPDGSRAEFSGNGARIAAAWLAERAGSADVVLRFDERDIRARVEADAVTVEVGHVEVAPVETLEVGGVPLEVTPVSVGNPHAVVRLDFEEADVLRLGPALERHPRFPERTNVQLVRVTGPHELLVGVWERGAGRTRSSGSSSVAAAAAAVANGWCEAPVSVGHGAEGSLRVELEPDGERAFRGRLAGPVRRVGTGAVRAGS